MLGAAFGQFGDVDEAVLAGEHFHERAEESKSFLNFVTANGNLLEK